MKLASCSKYDRLLLIGAILMALGLTACAETPAQKAARLEPTLAAAGFHMIPADTPSKQSIVNSLTPLKVNYYLGKDGQRQPHYWFADPYQCHCIYLGDEKAYQQYENLRIQQKLAEQEQRAAELNQDAAMQMNAFDPFWFP